MNEEAVSLETEAVPLKILLETREIRRFFGGFLPELVFVWAGDHPGKRRVARLADRILSKGFLRSSRKADKSILEHGDLLAGLAVRSADRLIDAWSESFEKMSLEEKAVCLERIIGRLFNGETGGLVTRITAALNQIHETDPEFLTRALKPGIRNWIAAADFGEIKECAGKSGRDFSSVIRLVNDELWRYPAKVVLLLALLPDAANLAAGGAKDTLSRLNGISPDLVADIILTLLREIDGETLGKLINEIAELIRKTGIGGALIGEPGASKITGDLSRFFEEIVSALDPEKLLKAQKILSEQKAGMKKSLLDVLKERPEIFLETAARYPALEVDRMSPFFHLLTILDDMPEDKTAAAMEKGLAGIDTDLIADTVNLIMGLTLRFMENQPGTFSKVFSGTLNQIDPDLFYETASGLFEEINPDLIPFLRPLAPKLIHGFCDALESQPDEYESELEDAKKRLARLLIQGEE